MKRHVIWILLICLLPALVLSRSAINPGDYTGTWYGPDGTYLFREGIIRRQGSESVMDGAYAFTAHSITLFVTDTDGLDTVITLHRISGKNGDVLCQTPDGLGTVYFSRSQP